MMRPDHGARARLRVWHASRAWIPNRHATPLHEVERLARQLRQAGEAAPGGIAAIRMAGTRADLLTMCLPEKT